MSNETKKIEGKEWTFQDNERFKKVMARFNWAIENTPEDEGTILCFNTGRRLSEEEALEREASYAIADMAEKIAG